MDLAPGAALPVPVDAVPSAAFDLFASVAETQPGKGEVRFFDASGRADGASVRVSFPAPDSKVDTDAFETSFDSTVRRLVVQKAGAGVALIDVTARRILRQWPEGTFAGFSESGALCALLLEPHHAAIYHSEDGRDAGDLPGNTKRPFGWTLACLQPGDDLALMLLTFDKTLEVWNWQDPRRVSLRNADETIARVAWSRDLFAGAGKEMSQVTLWNLRTGRVRSLPTDDSFPASLTFAANGRWLVAASRRGTSSSVWDTVTGQRVLQSTEVFPRHFSADGTRFTQHVNGRLTLGQVRRSAALQTLDVSAVSQGLAFLDISPDGRWLLLNSRELSESRATAGCLSIWEIATRRLVYHHNRFSHIVPAAFLADSAHIVGQRVVPHGSTEGTFCIHTLAVAEGALSLEERKEVMPVDLKVMPGLELSPDRRWAAVGGETGALLFDLADPSATSAGKRMSRAALDALVIGEAWSGQGNGVQPAAGNEQITARPWPPPRVSPDGRWCAEMDGRQLRVMATRTQRVAHEHTVAFRLGFGLPLAWSPDSRWLAYAGQRDDVTLVEAATGQTVAELSGSLDDPIVALRFTPDGRTLVLLHSAGVLEFWDLSVLAAELSAMGLPWELPPALQPAPPGITVPVKEAHLTRLYVR